MSVDWYDVLKAARRVGSREQNAGGKKMLEAVEFTVAQLAEEAGLESRRLTASEKKAVEAGQMSPPGTPEDLASAWIGKFVRWGYVQRVKRKTPDSGGRKVMFYALTKWGLSFRRRRTGDAEGRVAANKG